MEAETQCLEIDQAKGMAWKITFHLPSEAIKHEKKFPKEVRYLSLPISADSLDAQCSGMIQVGGPLEGRERKRGHCARFLHPLAGAPQPRVLLFQPDFIRTETVLEHHFSCSRSNFISVTRIFLVL